MGPFIHSKSGNYHKDENLLLYESRNSGIEHLLKEASYIADKHTWCVYPVVGRNQD
jgi:hypothetical protein